MRYLLEHAAGERGWKIRVASLPYQTDDPAELVDAVAGQFTSATRILFFSHVSSPSGLILPAVELCKLARERGAVSVIDGAHAPGMIPVDVEVIGADFYAGNCHKWLLAPLGAAFLHVRASWRSKMEPRITSWGWDYDEANGDADSGWGGSFWARNLEFQGTLDRCPQLVLPEVLDFRASLGDEAVFARQRWLAARVRERLSSVGLKPATSASPKLTGSLTVVSIPQVDPIKGRDWLWHNYRLEAPFTTTAGHWFWRISTAWFNTVAEIDRLAEVAAAIRWDELR
jgi:isopenicillin-N epimerase